MTRVVPRQPRRLALVLLVVGILLVGVTIVLVQHNVPAPTDAGALPTMSTTSSGPDSASPSSPSSPAGIARSAATTAASQRIQALSSTAPGTVGPVSTPSAAAPETTAPASSTTAGRPVELQLPTLHVTARVDPVDSTNGVLQVPEDISRVGWWQYSASAGATSGSTVIDGHIDSAVTGEGALFHLDQLSPGDPVSVTTSAGSTIHYQVQARRVYVKAQGLPADLFSQQGPGRLVIISCGGTFDKTIRSYEENVAIFATPVS